MSNENDFYVSFETSPFDFTTSQLYSSATASSDEFASGFSTPSFYATQSTSTPLSQKSTVTSSQYSDAHSTPEFVSPFPAMSPEEFSQCVSSVHHAVQEGKSLSRTWTAIENARTVAEQHDLDTEREMEHSSPLQFGVVGPSMGSTLLSTFGTGPLLKEEEATSFSYPNEREMEHSSPLQFGVVGPSMGSTLLSTFGTGPLLKEEEATSFSYPNGMPLPPAFGMPHSSQTLSPAFASSDEFVDPFCVEAQAADDLHYPTSDGASFELVSPSFSPDFSHMYLSSGSRSHTHRTAHRELSPSFASASHEYSRNPAAASGNLCDIPLPCFHSGLVSAEDAHRCMFEHYRKTCSSRKGSRSLGGQDHRQQRGRVMRGISHQSSSPKSSAAGRCPRVPSNRNFRPKGYSYSTTENSYLVAVNHVFDTRSLTEPQLCQIAFACLDKEKLSEKFGADKKRISVSMRAKFRNLRNRDGKKKKKVSESEDFHKVCSHVETLLDGVLQKK
ncbi:hypothetical protein ADUPG1_000877 [Aduncisulcus paluster]|uniref:Uncharacterized protein n=1 Tax=Aduncisulcus paluster TaxID=2918883 RepID=A0ABQ5KAA6_9EUKA|nr:hypothetical protein ADUPG1_000877 [Aduncisulcus paluster]